MAPAFWSLMPRLPRSWIIHEGLSFHKVWRGHNKEWNIKTKDEKLAYLRFLEEELPHQESPLHSFCLMSNHAHEIYNLLHTKAFSELMRRHHTRYGLFFNRKHHRRGKVAQDRPFTSAIENDEYEMETTFYIHANPLRAKMVKDAKDYVWSTHNLYAYGKRAKWMKFVTFPDWYMRLGRTWRARQRKYRQLFDAYLREKGLIKQGYSVYGIGGLLWKSERREVILSMWKERYGPSG